MRLPYPCAMRALTALLLAALPLAAGAAPPADRLAERLPEPYPGYARECGYPILFKATRHVSFARIHPRHGPVIWLDPTLSLPHQRMHRLFLIAHECAHHRLGHTTPRGLKLRAGLNGVPDQELSADCWAAEALTRAGHERMARLIGDQMYRKGLYSPGARYPSGVQRSTMIVHCIDRAKALR